MKQETIEWKEVALGDNGYFEILSSGINKFEGEKEYLSTESIKGTKIKKIECKITHSDRPSRANMQPIINSVWFAKMKATLKVYGFAKENENEIKKYILSTGFVGIKLNKDISASYIKLYFISKMFNDNKDKLSTGSTQVGINNSFIVKIKVPIPFSNGKPDLKEQERIVLILEKAEKVKTKGDNAGKLLDEYLKSVFNEMFFTKHKFSVRRLEEFCDKITDGTHKTPVYNNTGVTFLSAKNVGTGRIDWDNIKFISEKEHELLVKRTCPEYGDILLSKSGSIGVAVLVDKKERFSIFESLALIKSDRKIINNKFLCYWLNCDFIKDKYKKATKGVAIKHLHLDQLRKIEVISPPLPLQQKFAKIVEHVEGLKENVRKTKQNSEELFSSLMTKAFRGEL